MANEFAHDKMCTLWDKVAETTSMKMSLSRDLETYNMDSDANMDRAADASDNSNANGSDREFIPQDYRFQVQEGIVSEESDAQDLVDRMIPVNRGKSIRILAEIDAKGLRDPMRRDKVAQGFGRDLANYIDLYAYQSMINGGTMCIKNDTKFTFQQGIDAEVLMLNRGLGAFDKKLFLANSDYAQVAKDLGIASRDVLVNDALSRAKIPDLATFDTMRSDYLVSLAGNTTANLAVTSETKHTVATYGADEFYLDNRFMTLPVTNGTATNFPVGTKFTIAGVNFLHPETRVDSGELQTFTVKTSTTGSAVVSPALVVDGPYRNCSAAAAAAAAIVILNVKESKPSLFYTPESTVIVPGRLPVPADGAGVRSVEASTEQGLPMRMTYWYDGHKEKFIMKGLVYFDVQVVYPDMVGTILSNQA